MSNTTSAAAAHHVCARCNRVFERKDNLNRHLHNKTDCAAKTTSVTEHSAVQLLQTLLHVLRGPLKLADTCATADAPDDPTYELRVVCDIWKATVAVAELKIRRDESLFDILLQLFRFFNEHQLQLLFGTVMATIVPPTEALLHSLRAVYTHLHQLNQKGVPNLHGHPLPTLLKFMLRLPALFSGVK
jgi:hypothetical protein